MGFRRADSSERKSHEKRAGSERRSVEDLLQDLTLRGRGTLDSGLLTRDIGTLGVFVGEEEKRESEEKAREDQESRIGGLRPRTS